MPSAFFSGSLALEVDTSAAGGIEEAIEITDSLMAIVQNPNILFTDL